jgi:general secretion pathway protein G
MASALVAFTADMGRLPTTSEGLTVLIEKPAGAKNWRGPYVTRGPGRIDDKPFLDPWGTQYRYTNTSRSTTAPTFEIRSAGPDMIFDNTDDLVING